MANRQGTLTGTTAKATRGRAALGLERALAAARKLGQLQPSDAGMVALARTVAHALDGAMAGQLEARDVTELARELRMAYRELGLTPSERAKRAATESADPLERLFAGLDVPTP